MFNNLTKEEAVLNLVLNGYSLKYIILSSLDPTAKTTEVLNLVLNGYSLKFYNILTIGAPLLQF